ncbi:MULTISPECIES: MarR family winged helix-turn-helix transcriptional regulator [unclassified Colwellia]|jgi:DNA-binding MarR family transcriptional regulator|uniref:MarR family winged helix-turn-helix transcriptional regulator n=1 Tax=unclassified Colwellia TaxID=196834 RepID=UPI0015F6BA36|nr:MULTISPECIES: MarR family transcriptional regulator [unclassified Colwellia]MBA6225437.1 MarR family transcriptional regulator [Colwellia sp. MB3u-45]MBA6266655.1 MarR family transcriptional regulator [Colwellia sp. MB3u-43]MBA6287524.1 MarR family transcriptional regulator [Colwellia sp. MB3u-4]MBA6294549.1 MarR family transcriptional regulator [Colwellia sp. MB02u-9]MBA6320696.1 MarR family transcriptional regulator [Colwellia sp. MB02u-19]
MEKHQELLISLRKVIRAIDLHSKHLNKTSGLTSPQLLIMLEIDKEYSINSSQVAKKVNLSPATVTNIIDRLENKNLISRVRYTQDKRKVGLYLTDDGKALLLKAPQALQEHFIEKFSNLEQWEQSQLLSSMERLSNMMDADKIDAAPLLELQSL